jgi:hypothetical protein
MAMLRIDPEEFAKLQARIALGANRRHALGNTAATVKAAGKSTGRRNKYGAEATEVNGIRFDSKAEAKRYMQLKAMEKGGEIRDLRIQVAFELIPAQVVHGRKERPVKYVADFVYLDQEGNQVVEDTKSAPTKTREYTIKRKLMAWRHGIAIREVLMD